MWHKHRPETINVGQWPIFHGPVILPYILKTVWWTNVISGILDPCDATMYHIKCMWFSDLHFMVQWFCLISWRPFGAGMLSGRYWFSATLSLTYKCICKSVTNISWYSDSALYIQYYSMNTPHSLDIGSVWYKPLTYISWLSNFESFARYFLPIKCYVDMLTSWHFGVGGDIFGSKTCFVLPKMQKTGIILQNSMVVIAHG